MKFTVNIVTKSGARFGLLSDFFRIPNAVLETPYLLLHTRGASVPHLSYDLLQMVTSEPQMLQMPLVTLVDTVEAVRAYGKGIADFAGMKEHLSYVTLQDSGTATPEGYHLKNSVSIWTRGGRKLVDAPFYVSCIEAMKPDVFQMLSDGDSNINSSSKRLKKSVDATVKFASICANLREKSDVLNKIPMFASVVGGYNVNERLRCINSLKEFSFAGYVIDGFHTNGEDTANLVWEDVDPVMTDTLSALPENQPRVFHGAVTPCILLNLVSKGIDIFDATFPWIVAERGGALIFPNSISSTGCEIISETLPLSTCRSSEKVDETTDDKCSKKIPNENRFYEIDLKEKRYFDDSKPLVDDCSCYTCRKYSRAYINHLLMTSELLGPILLMMHNLYHYLCFFKNIRLAIKEDKLEVLQEKLQSFVNSRNQP